MAKKGYWIAHVNITNPERYKDYIAANAAPLKKYGARFLVRAGDSRRSRGPARGAPSRRHRVRQLRRRPRPATTRPSTRLPRKIRDEASTGEFVIIEGYEG